MPRITGLFSAEANYIQTATSLQVSAEAGVEKLTYEQQPVGNIGLGATWLPGDKGTHYLNAYFRSEDQEVMIADAVLTQNNGRDSLEVNTTFEHFPLSLANAFMPDQVVTFTGDIDGGLYISGAMEKPKLSGDLSLDSVSVYARQAGARYWFDNRPLKIEDNQLIFNKFAIYTTSRNPFTIDGNVDFRNMENPTAKLNLRAQNYTLLDAPRTKESMIYGKIFVDLNATVRGPLDGLTMRGNMNLLGNTDVTYVLTDSPLTVEDRLGELVTFTSFTDTTSVRATEVPTMSLGGMDMLLSVHIDDAVRLRADLSPDRSSRVELEGGGDLNLQYTPQGDLTAKHKTDTCLGYLTIEHTFIVLVVEHADIACTTIIQTILQRNIIDERFYVIRCIGATRYLSADYNLYTIIEETLRVSETVVRLFVPRFGSRTCFCVRWR